MLCMNGFDYCGYKLRDMGVLFTVTSCDNEDIPTDSPRNDVAAARSTESLHNDVVDYSLSQTNNTIN